MPKNIVYCCDGTNNEVTGHSTNVLRLYRMLVRGPDQVSCYDGGVGTLADPTALTTLRKRIGRHLDAAIGLGIAENFAQAYRFLGRHYEPGDRIYLFGFSRGAYTVRAVAGAIHLLGLARPELVETLTPMVWSVYANDGGALDVSRRFGGGARFRNCFSVEPKARVHFVGVWDTVSSFGWIWNHKTLPHTANNPSIDHVRHALAIDERRACFGANLFYPDEPGQHRSIKQVWFPGVHSDVGGGYPDEEGSLSKVPLAWMLREAEAEGLLVDAARKHKLLGGEKGYSVPDPCGPAHDSLKGLWRLIEWLPRRSWNPARRAMAWAGPNRGRCRRMAAPCTVHESVRLRGAMPGGYSPAHLPASYDLDR